MVKRKTLSEQIADELFAMVTTKKIFAPGEKLPNEVDLAKQLGVSRVTLRQAINYLASEGVLEVYRGKGTFVAKNMQALGSFGLEKLDARISLHLNDLFEARLLFEPATAALACKRATEDELAGILRLGEKVEADITAGRNRIESDQAFHAAIAKASHNEFATQLIPIITQAIKDAVTLESAKFTAWKLASYSLQDHRMIMDFMKRRDASGTKRAMYVHLRHAINLLSLDVEDIL